LVETEGVPFTAIAEGVSPVMEICTGLADSSAFKAKDTYSREDTLDSMPQNVSIVTLPVTSTLDGNQPWLCYQSKPRQ
jgi:hypothetical protein